MKILLTGQSGQIASAIAAHPGFQSHQLQGFSHQDLDITNNIAIQKKLSEYRPDIVINTAAYTAVDKAEQSQDLADLVNITGAKNLAIHCQHLNIPLIHLSTDYVFDGKSQHAYTETDTTHPVNYYGRSKLLGEEAIRSHTQQYLILRTSSVFSEYGTNFVKTILRLAQEKSTLQIVHDQISCPTYAGDIAAILLQLCETQPAWGIYHFSNQHPISWYHFAEAIVSAAKKWTVLKTENIQAISSRDYAAPAMRPAYSVLNCDKIQHTLAIIRPDWQSGLHQTLQALYKRNS